MRRSISISENAYDFDPPPLSAKYRDPGFISEPKKVNQSAREEKTMTGKVKWFNNQKGYGFITRDDGAGDVFVHYSGIAEGGFKSLAEGSAVSFELIDSERGPKAINVKKLG